MKHTLFVALFALALAPVDAFADSFEFGGKPTFTTITFESKMDVEDIVGTTNQLAGSLTIDGGKATFDLSVPVASLSTGIDARDEHLKGGYWLDAAKFPTISFKGESLPYKGDGTHNLKGTFSLHGVDKPLTVEVTTKTIPAAVAKKAGLGETSFLKITGTFKVKLSDFGVAIPDMAAAKVNDEWTVKLSLFASGK